MSSASAQASERTQVTSRHLLRGAYSLAANTAVTSLLGMGFWVAAARLYSNVEIGRDAALIAAMLELSTICQLNLGNGILRFLPHLGARGARAVGIAYALASAMGLVLGSSFVLLAPRVSHQFAFMSASTTLEVGFVVALLLWGVFALQDAVLTATRRAPWIPIENGAFGVLKILALPVLLAAGAVHGVFLAWAIPMALLLIPVNLLVFRLAIPEHLAGGVGARTSSLERRRTGRAVRFLGQDYLASIFTQATLTVLPLLVLAILGARNSAYFAIPLMIALAFDTLAYSACTSLVVEASLEERHLGDLAEVVVRRVLAPLAPAGLLLIILAPLVLAPFGEAYAQHGAGVLRLLLCASLFRAGIALFSAVSRVERRGIRLGLIELALLVLVLGPAIPLADAYGVEGVGAGWLLANGAIFLAVLPWLLRVLREPRALQDE